MRRVFLAYALSGFVALGYQVAWFRIFADLFGSTTLTFALVICNFIAGLGLGSLISRRFAAFCSRRLGSGDTLRIYGLVELLAAVAALLTLAAMALPAGIWGDFPYHLQDGIWVGTPLYALGKVALASLCLFLPCLFLGVTFPLLCSAFVDTPEGGRFPAALYGWNTLGACCGVLASQFLLLPWLGHSAMFVVMIGLNAAIGVLFLSLGGAPARGTAAAAVSAPAVGPGPGLLLTTATLSGLLAGALEGDLFKRIGLVVANSPGALGPAISFWAILGIFLASAFVWKVKRLRLTHIKVAFVVAAIYYVAAWYWMYPVVTALEAVHAVPESAVLLFRVNTFPGSVGELFLFVGGCVFVPYFLVSLLLPYVCNQVQGGRGHLGLAYGLNTVAFCIGLIGFTLLAPLVNIFYSLKLMLVLLVAGVGLLLVIAENKGVRAWQPAAALALFVAGCVYTPTEFDASYLVPGSDQVRYRVSSVKSDGANTTFVAHVPDGARLFFGNMTMSGVNELSQTYMRLMAHFPLLMEKDPATALLICFGVGNTASAIAAHAGIRQIDIVDLNRRVFETAWEFADTNRQVFSDPRVRLINDDGRNFLRLTRNTYDLITSEPPPPMAAGVFRLYSREYYATVLAHLTPQGMMTQWLPIYQMPTQAVDEAIATFAEVFPETLLIVGSGSELILVGARQPMDLARLESNFPAAGPVQEDLRSIGVRNPGHLAIRIMRTDASLRRQYLAAGRISDQHNNLEHMFLTPAKATVIPYFPGEVIDLLEARAPRLAASAVPVISHLGRLRYRVELFPLYKVVADRDIALAAADWQRLTLFVRKAADRKAQGDGAGFLEELAASVQLAPEQPRLLIVLASELLRVGRLTEAAEYLRVFLRVEPEDAIGYLTLAQVFRAQGATRLALEQYQRVDALQPDRPGVLNEMAWLRAVTPDAALRDSAAAVRLATRAALLTDRSDPNILDTLAAALAAAGRFDDAERTAGEAIALARRRNDESLAADVAGRLAGYQQGRPFLEPPQVASQAR